MNPLPPFTTPPALYASLSGSYTPLNQEINQLVYNFRQGDVKAGEELLKRFQPLIRKYKIALWIGKIPEYDPDLRQFLSFFNKDKRTAVELLSKSLRRDEEADLDQLLSYSLLETAIKYNKISAGFKYVVKENICKQTKDASNHRTTLTVDFSDESIKNKIYKKDKSNRSITGYCDTESDVENFVTEGSTIPGLDTLTLFERTLAKQLYLDCLSHSEICRKLNITARQLRRRVELLRNKIRKGHY